MLVRFRKTVLRLPLTLLCLWIGAVFADAANLDDFFSSSIVHTEIPETAAAHNFSSDHISGVSHSNGGSSRLAFSSLLEKEIKPGKIIYDEDSPSLAPLPDNTSEGICLALKEAKQFCHSITISKPLYLKFCTLLI